VLASWQNPFCQRAEMVKKGEGAVGGYTTTKRGGQTSSSDTPLPDGQIYINKVLKKINN